MFAKDWNPLPHILGLFPPRDSPDAGSRNGLFLSPEPFRLKSNNLYSQGQDYGEESEAPRA